MTESETAAAEVVPEVPVPFMGREIYTRMPRPEQILVWQRTIDRLGKAPVDASWTGSEVMAALERLRKIVDSIIVNQADINWLDDGFLDGSITFQQLAPFIGEVAKAYADMAAATGNREVRRAAAKPKKATRKKA